MTIIASQRSIMVRQMKTIDKQQILGINPAKMEMEIRINRRETTTGITLITRILKIGETPTSRTVQTGDRRNPTSKTTTPMADPRIRIRIRIGIPTERRTTGQTITETLELGTTTLETTTLEIRLHGQLKELRIIAINLQAQGKVIQDLLTVETRDKTGTTMEESKAAGLVVEEATMVGALGKTGTVVKVVGRIGLLLVEVRRQVNGKETQRWGQILGVVVERVLLQRMMVGEEMV